MPSDDYWAAGSLSKVLKLGLHSAWYCMYCLSDPPDVQVTFWGLSFQFFFVQTSFRIYKTSKKMRFMASTYPATIDKGVLPPKVRFQKLVCMYSDEALFQIKTTV